MQALEPLPTPAALATGPDRRKSLRATVLGVGAAAPERVVANDHFVEQLKLDTTAHWIVQRTGIRERRFAIAGQTASELAASAAVQAISRAKVDPREIDVILVATSTPDYTMPSTACLVQKRLNVPQALAMDVVNACSGFVYALDAATRYLQTGAKRALVIGVDLGSRLVDYTDRGTCIFFGDGAGAVMLAAGGSGQVLASRMYSQGDDAPLAVPVGGAMFMDGRAIWNFATRVLPDTVRELCADAGVAVSDIRLLVPHQANQNIIAAAASELGLPLERVAVNIDRYGNTLAASIPLALEEALAVGRAQRGDLVALVGFGAGLAWGGVLLRL